MNVASLFERNAMSRSHLPALICGDLCWNHADLLQRSKGLAGWMLSRHGVEAGDHVAIISFNRPAYLEALLACWWAGLVPVPINAKLHRLEMAVILKDSQAKLVLCDESFGGCHDVPTLPFDGSDYDEAIAFEPAAKGPWRSEDIAWLFYTSGTTGRPKGAMITHGNLFAMIHAYFIDIDSIATSDCIVHAAPMSHGSGLYILPHAARGAAQIIPKSGGFDPGEILELCCRYQGVTMFMAPTMVRRFVSHVAESDAQPKGLKTIVYGGAPMYAADLDKAHEVLGYRLAQLYGQGESPMTITALDKVAHADTGHPRYRERLHSAGIAQTVCEVLVTDNSGRALPSGEVGEIRVRGASVVPGYWNNAKATTQTFPDGWLRTGDMGSIDEDGFLTIRDRSKDLIISGGSNIYPKEVEDVLLRHQGVDEVSVVGLPDREWGEIVVACVVLNRDVDDSTLEQHCLDNMARFKRPRRYVRMQTLPKSSYGKILKRELRSRLLEG